MAQDRYKDVDGYDDEFDNDDYDEFDDCEDDDSEQPRIRSFSGSATHYDLSDDSRLRKDHHNQLERKRRASIKSSYTELREAIPSLKDNKASRSIILQRAVEYIDELSKRNSEHVACVQHFNEQNASLETKCQEMEQQVQVLLRHQRNNSGNDANSSSSVIGVGGINCSIRNTRSNLVTTALQPSNSYQLGDTNSGSGSVASNEDENISTSVDNASYNSIITDRSSSANSSYNGHTRNISNTNSNNENNSHNTVVNSNNDTIVAATSLTGPPVIQPSSLLLSSSSSTSSSCTSSSNHLPPQLHRQNSTNNNTNNPNSSCNSNDDDVTVSPAKKIKQ